MKVEIIIPTELSEITLTRYQEYIAIKDKNEDSFFLLQKMISIFCGIPMLQVAQMKYTSVQDIATVFQNMFEQKTSFVNRFELGGKEFGFIPDLENISMGEYVDLDTNIGDIQNFHKAMAVMYRPITKKWKDKYEIEEYHGTANYSEVMKFAPLDVVLGAMLFFYHLGNELLTHSALYLGEEVEKMSTQWKRNSGRSGDGTQAFTHLQQEMLQNLNKLKDYL